MEIRTIIILRMIGLLETHGGFSASRYAPVRQHLKDRNLKVEIASFIDLNDADLVECYEITARQFAKQM